MARGPCLRMRLRWESESLSSPDCLSHLRHEEDGKWRNEIHFNIGAMCV